jgi:hypothetical protein
MPQVLSETRLHLIKMMIQHPPLSKEALHAAFCAYQTSVEEVQQALAAGVSEEALNEEMEALAELFQVLIPHIELYGLAMLMGVYKPGTFSVEGNTTLH